jgi:hypothetical protein
MNRTLPLYLTPLFFLRQFVKLIAEFPIYYTLVFREEVLTLRVQGRTRLLPMHGKKNSKGYEN